MNADKTEYLYINQKEDIFTLNCGSLKLVEKFEYLGSSISSKDNDINLHLAMIDRFSIIGNSDLSDKIKRNFFQAAVVSILLYGFTTWTLTKCIEKKLDGNYTRMLRTILNKYLMQHSTKQQLYGHLPPSLKPFKLDEQDPAG